jgi:hypothetical protein
MINETTAGPPQDSAESVGSKVGSATESVKDKASHVAAEARDRGARLIDEGREKAGELSDRAGVKARSRVEQEKDRLTDGIRTFADALRRGSDDLSGERDQYRPLLNSAADRAEGISSYLEQHDVDALTSDVRRFAREHTPLFLGGVFALGFVGARFLKSSGEYAAREREAGRYAESGREDRFERLLPDPDGASRSGAAFEDGGSGRGGLYE